jgi:two-component system chemotaxis response regulator CheY
MKRVLIVDDSKIFQSLVEKILSPHFTIVGKASNGNEGFDMHLKLKPDITILDIVMPNCTGKECLKKIMENDRSAKVIMVSSVGDESTISECLRMGASGFVKKEQIAVKDQTNSQLVTTVKSATLSLGTKEAV